MVRHGIILKILCKLLVVCWFFLESIFRRIEYFLFSLYQFELCALKHRKHLGNIRKTRAQIQPSIWHTHTRDALHSMSNYVYLQVENIAHTQRNSSSSTVWVHILNWHSKNIYIRLNITWEWGRENKWNFHSGQTIILCVCVCVPTFNSKCTQYNTVGVNLPKLIK